MQSVFDPHGPEAAAIATIARVLFVGGGLIFVLVLGLAALAFVAPRRWLAGEGPIFWGGIVLPSVVLSALMLYTLLAPPRLAAEPPAELRIEVTGHQWWWRVHYLDAEGRVDFATANEIRLPAGRIVELRLRSADVLHSFWVPALAGKLDMIPGKDNRLRLVADRTGTFRGQCAEYCGGPHAQMALFVRVETAADFEAWREAQRLPARADPAARGERLFLAHCAACHAVRGTAAKGELGPDLTHFASRLSVGAGILANHKANLAGWIAGSQHLKPGNLMPEFREFGGEDLHLLVAWLSALE